MNRKDDMPSEPSRCPFHPVTLPDDGTPLRPSPSIAAWREEAPATPLDYEDGHHGLIATRYSIVRTVLEDPRFSLHPARMPLGPDAAHAGSAEPGSAGPGPHASGDHDANVVDDGALDAAAVRSERANLLRLDGQDHARLRRAITSRFSFRHVRSRQPDVADTVSRQLEIFRSEGAPNDVWRRYAQPIASITHCQVLGIPLDMHDRFVDLFVGGGSEQEKYNFVREIIERRRDDPGDDVVTDLLTSDVVDPDEAVGLLHMLMSSGRDSVAYLISTAMVALLTHEDQLAKLQREPEAIGPAIEEFMRTGAMFLTLFPRTATEDVDIDGFHIPAGTTVSASPVGANRDPRRWDEPERFDLDRDAFGHIGFGHGIHGCIGQQLARVEIREAITRLLELPGLRLVRAEQLEPLPFAHPVATYEAGEVVVAWDGP